MTKLRPPDAGHHRYLRVLGMPLGQGDAEQDPTWLSASPAALKAANDNLSRVPGDADTPRMTPEQRKGLGAAASRELPSATRVLAQCLIDAPAVPQEAQTTAADLSGLADKDADLRRMEDAGITLQSRVIQGRLLVAGAQAQVHEMFFSFLQDKTANLRPGDAEYDKWMGVFDEAVLVRDKWLGFTTQDRKYNALEGQQQDQLLQGMASDLLLVQTVHDLRWGNEVSDQAKAEAGAHLAAQQAGDQGTGAAKGKKGGKTGAMGKTTTATGKTSATATATPKKGTRRGQTQKA